MMEYGKAVCRETYAELRKRGVPKLLASFIAGLVAGRKGMHHALYH